MLPQSCPLGNSSVAFCGQCLYSGASFWAKEFYAGFSGFSGWAGLEESDNRLQTACVP